MLLALHRVGPYHHARFVAACAYLDLTVVETRPHSQEYPWIAPSEACPYARIAIEGADEVEDDPPIRALRKHWARILHQLAPVAVVSVGWADRAYQVLLQQAQRRRLPLVIVSDSRLRDGPRSAPREWLKAQLLAGYSAALVAGAESRAYLERLGFPAPAIHQPWDVVDNAYFHSSGRSPALDPACGAHFLCVSRFVLKKNHDGLLRAYGTYQQEGGSWGLHLVGFGPLEPQLHAWTATLPHPSRCRIRPFLQLPQLARAYHQASALVLASLADQWGLVVNEAIAAGLPALVSTGCGCAADLIQPGVTGLSFDPASTRELADQLHRMERLTPVERQAMVVAARQRLQAFSPDSFGRALRQAVDQSLQSPRRNWRSGLVAGVLSQVV